MSSRTRREKICRKKFGGLDLGNLSKKNSLSLPRPPFAHLPRPPRLHVTTLIHRPSPPPITTSPIANLPRPFAYRHLYLHLPHPSSVVTNLPHPSPTHHHPPSPISLVHRHPPLHSFITSTSFISTPTQCAALPSLSLNDNCGVVHGFFFAPATHIVILLLLCVQSCDWSRSASAS